MPRNRPNPVRGVLAEEAIVVKSKIVAYKKALRSLLQGSLVEKRIRKGSYFYLARRIKGKVKFKYMGKLSVEERARFEEAKKKRAMYRGYLADLNAQAAYLKKALHERKRNAA